MSNTLIIDSLNTLFSMSNTAVIGAQEQFVAFMNPAAQELFRGNRTNHKLTELLPAHITEATATEFVTSATIEKRHVIISVTSFGAFRLFSFVPRPSWMNPWCPSAESRSARLPPQHREC